MRIAVLADIHANLEALQAVLARIGQLHIDELFCLGDLVGYNADPNACVALVRGEKAVCVLGNHDAAAAGIEEPITFSPLARTALFWTRAQLSSETRQFLADLPRERQVRDLYLFHGSIHNTNRYLMTRNDADENFRLLAETRELARIGLFGHTHVGMLLPDAQGAEECGDAYGAVLSRDTRYLINPGSVGQPRDGDSRASFLVYDDREARVTFYRVEYDRERCQDKMLRAGLPPQLAGRLASGR